MEESSTVEGKPYNKRHSDVFWIFCDCIQAYFIGNISHHHNKSLYKIVQKIIINTNNSLWF